MSKRLKNGSLIAVAIASLMTLLMMLATPALAEPGKGKGQDKKADAAAAEATATGDHDGDADSDPGTAEEDDHTTPDDGDNAHPSGKDRSVENGGSGNQGKSESNPDDHKGPQRCEGTCGNGDPNVGDDKPGGAGGTDQDDQDGNNGCGNDDDFDDDNNGHCGKPKPPPPPPCDPAVEDCDPQEPPCDPAVEDCGGEPPVCDPNVEECDPDDVDGGVITEPPDDDVLGGRTHRGNRPGPRVLGTRFERGGVLPFTGAGSVLMYLALSMALMISGGLLWRLNRN
jgi:hypothetical protein